MGHREKCTYKTTYKEECSDKKQRVCEKFWKEDGYGGKVWTEDPSKCHWLQESECMQVPHPVKDCKDVWGRCASRSTRTSPSRRSARCAEAWRRAARRSTPNTMAIE